MMSTKKPATNHYEYCAVCFDVDGVLTKIDSIWRFLHKRFGTLQEAQINASLFKKGLISYEKWAVLDATLWRGKTKSVIRTFLKEIPLREYAIDILKYLKRRNIKLIAISAGLDIVIREIERRSKVKFDSVYTNKLVFKEGVLTGDVVVHVEYYNKDRALLSACKELGINPREVVSIGDSEVDVPMFRVSGLAVAFNPKSRDVLSAADLVMYSETLKPLLDLFSLLF
ncbi:MAG: hypothetical protein DRJ52_00330 [Thermoprotei archaeon]|nr:MAG: hypothetical protein DRJ52_00330 [Thermoprotei archaeon]RLF00302.1 MAG: hypothetical protein DRJ63_02905 [Thermoprotei archaeon]